MRLPLSERQRKIVALIDDDYVTYEEIGEELDIGRSTVRKEIAVLCARYGCGMFDLPAAVEREGVT